jgi:YD repeat-containing protein
MEWEIVTFSPIVNGVAPFGLLEKFAGAAAIENYKSDKAQTEVTLRDGGTVGFFCAAAPRRVTVDGRAVRTSYDASTRLLKVKVPEGKSVTIVVEHGV